MAEVTMAREGRVSSINASGRSMAPARQRSAIMNANVEPSQGSTRINLGGGYSATINVSYINRSQGYIRGTLNTRNISNGQNQFRFGGSTGMSFEEALREVKRDMMRNV